MSALHNAETGFVDEKLWESNPSSVDNRAKQKDKEIGLLHTSNDCNRNENITTDEEIFCEIISDDEKKEENSESRMFFNRIIVCLLAVSLLWITSLQVSIYFLSRTLFDYVI